MNGRVRVGVIGLGRMGGPIADHLIAAGHDVRVYDIAETAMAPRVAAGATAATSPMHAAEGAAFISVIVFDDAQVTEAIAGPEGVLRTLEPGAIVSVHTTVSIETIHSLAAKATAIGVAVIDAGISGGEVGAAAGTLLTMVGGPADVIERVRPVLRTFSKEVLHAGPLGAGMALKLARNACGYAMMAAVHEAMELARRSSVDLEMLRHTIETTGVLDQALAPFNLGGPDLLPDDAPAATRLAMEHLERLADKDLAQALVLAQRVGVATPVFVETHRTFRRVARL